MQIYAANDNYCGIIVIDFDKEYQLQCEMNNNYAQNIVIIY